MQFSKILEAPMFACCFCFVFIVYDPDVGLAVFLHKTTVKSHNALKKKSTIKF